MAALEFWLSISSLAGLLLGCLSISWAKSRTRHALAWWGRRLFVAVLLSIGVVAVVAAGERADGLISLGLLAGFLVVLMLWDMPEASWQQAAGNG